MSARGGRKSRPAARRWSVAVLALVAAALALVSATRDSAAERPAYRTLPWNAASGEQVGAGDAERKAYSTDVRVGGAAWLRLTFADVRLGEGSYVLMRAKKDGASQKLDAEFMAEWSNASAVFNGDEVSVELHVGPNDKGASVRVATVLAGESRPYGIETICGTDDRVGSTDNRVGRLFFEGCTVWRIGNGAFLTAGHCADSDPDQNGPLLPDGVLDMSNNSIVEFNVPASLSNTTIVQADPNHQYPVSITGLQWRFDGAAQGLGKDWAVFRVGRNANTGLTPSQAYGVPFRITRELPAAAQTLRVTGFGADDSTFNQTNQTSDGPFVGEVTSGADIRVDYTVDSQGGNSGSPIIWESNGLCIGIHTNGGCTAMGGSNSGTSFEVDALENAINGFPGTNARHVDSGHPLAVTPDGTVMRPWATLGAGLSGVPVGGILTIWPQSYPIPSGTTIVKAMTLSAPAGVVTITGN